MAELDDKLDTLGPEVVKEIEEWDKLEVYIDSVVKINTIGTHCLLRALVELLVEGELIDLDELVKMRDTKNAELLREVRKQVEPEIRKAKLKAAGIHVPNMAIPGKLKKLH